MKSPTPTVLLALCFSAPLLGCGVEPETLDSLREAVTQVSNPQSSAGTIAITERGVGQPSGDLGPARFDPPHPERVDPFRFPGGITAANRGEPAMTGVAHVELLGFANVDEPRVFLRTRSATRSLAVGDSAEGIEVVAINPPAVELKTGGLTWLTTLFDNADAAKN